jgi:hypothetical protein
MSCTTTYTSVSDKGYGNTSESFQIFEHVERQNYIVTRHLIAEVCSQRSTAETSIARQRLAKHVSAEMDAFVQTRALLRN